MSVLFAAFLGYNPIARLVPAHVLHQLPAASSAALTSHDYFANLIAEPFKSGLHEAFAFAIAACLVAAACSWSRGGRYIAEEAPEAPAPAAAARRPRPSASRAG